MSEENFGIVFTRVDVEFYSFQTHTGTDPVSPFLPTEHAS